MARIHLVAILVFSLLATTLASASEPSVKARLSVDGKAIPLTYVYAFTAENAFDEN